MVKSGHAWFSSPLASWKTNSRRIEEDASKFFFKGVKCGIGTSVEWALEP